MNQDNEAAKDPRNVSHRNFSEHDVEDHHSLAMYVGVHVLGANQRRYHHHHRKHKSKYYEKNKESSENKEFPKSSTPPSERVRFIIGGTEEDESHAPHPIFSEMEELFYTGNKMEWMETARWIKYEEDVEEGGNRWSKPHIATVSFHWLLVLRSCLLNGTVLLDLNADTIEDIADIVVEEMILNGLLLPEHREEVTNVFLCRHRHKKDQYYNLWSDPKNVFHPVKSVAEIGMQSRASSSQAEACGGCGLPTTFGEHPMSSDDKNPLIISTTATLCSQRKLSSASVGERLKDQAVLNMEADDHSRQDGKKEFRWCNVSVMKKIPENAHASNILVGELPFLERTLTAFIRLENATLLGNLTEIPLPTKFIFISLCPVNKIDGYHEVGRAFATVMSDEVFHDVAYKAKTRSDLLSGIDEFMDAATVLPAGGWDPSTRIQPLPRLSQDLRRFPDLRELPTYCDGDDKDRSENSSLKRTGKFFGGLVSDIHRKARFYCSDFRDFFAIQSMAAVLFLYFACLAPIITFGGLLGVATEQRMAAMENILSSHVCGVLYGLLSGQPLTLLGNTGALLVFEGTIFTYCESWGIDYLPFRLWVGLWTAFMLLFLVLLDASVLVCYVTRFTGDVFATLISLIFIVKAFQNVIHIGTTFPMKSSRMIDPNVPPVCQCVYSIYADPDVPYNTSQLTDKECLDRKGTYDPDSCVFPIHYVPNVYLMSLILFAGTFAISLWFRKIRDSPYFPIKVRHFMSDFAAAIGMISMTVLDACLGIGTPKLNVPDQFKPTWSGRDWLIPFFGNNAWWTAIAAVLPALVATILMFMDQQVTAVIVNRRENKLKKGCGYHLDLFVIAVLIAICSIFGLPWIVAATMLSMTHVSSLEVVDRKAAPGEKPHFLGIREQRGTSIFIFVLVGLSIFFTPVLRLIPMPVLYGIFLYMGVSSLKGLQFLNRLLIWFMPQKYQPDYIFLRHIPQKVVHTFTLLQLVFLIILFFIKYFHDSSLFFPFMLILVIVIRRRIIVKFFNQTHLKILDDDTPVVMKRRYEEHESIDNLHQIHTATTICGTSSKGQICPESRPCDSFLLNISENLLQSSLWKCIDQQIHKSPPARKKSTSSQRKKGRRRSSVVADVCGEETPKMAEEEPLQCQAQLTSNRGIDNPFNFVRSDTKTSDIAYV